MKFWLDKIVKLYFILSTNHLEDEDINDNNA